MIYGPCSICGAPATIKAGDLRLCNNHKDHKAPEEVVKPAEVDFRTKEGKAWKAAQTAEIVEAVDLARAQAQAFAVRSQPDLAALLAEGRPEVSAFWLDEQTGELCKCRPDWVSPAGDGVILVDGKTCRDASPEGFGRAIWNLSYRLVHGRLRARLWPEGLRLRLRRRRVRLAACGSGLHAGRRRARRSAA